MEAWASAAEVLASCPDADDEAVPAAVEAATEVLWMRSGRFLGTRLVTVRPCARPDHSWTGTWDPSWGTAVTWGQGWCHCRQSSASCRCGAGPSEIRLGIGPLLDVTRVMVDGVEVLDADRQVQESEWLVYLADADGRPRYWPTRHNRLDLPDTEVGTFSVTARVGTPVPRIGKLAAIELACSLLAETGGCTDCGPPKNASTVTKDGVTYELISLAEALVNSDSFPLPQVQAFLSSVNPQKLQRRARVLWPPLGRPRRVDNVGS